VLNLKERLLLIYNAEILPVPHLIGLLVKLFKSGIQGKMWKWIQNFLDERLAKCLVNNTEGEWFKTNIGLPQGV
jgi:hypothetical protein